MNKKWSRYHNACVNCDTTEIPHNARGLCRKCYAMRRKFIRTNPGAIGPSKLLYIDTDGTETVYSSVFMTIEYNHSIASEPAVPVVSSYIN